MWMLEIESSYGYLHLENAQYMKKYGSLHISLSYCAQGDRSFLMLGFTFLIKSAEVFVLESMRLLLEILAVIAECIVVLNHSTWS